MTRGRLIAPLTVEIAQLDTAAATYDPEFRTPLERVEKEPIRLLAQVEAGSWERQNQTQAGNVPSSTLTLVFFSPDLEAAGVSLRVNDRLVGIYNREGTVREESSRVPAGGLYAVAVEPAGLGLGGRRNLCLVTFAQRNTGLAANP